MNPIFEQGFQQGFFYGAAAMALLAISIWLGWSMLYDRQDPYAGRVEDDYDPTHWCNGCGARYKRNCRCGPIVGND